MSSPFRIEYAGVKRTPEAWGVTLGQLTVINQNEDQLMLEVKRTARFAAPIFAYEQKVVIWDGATRIFTGVVTKLPIAATAQSEATGYTISGAWWYLKRAVYMQGRTTFGDINAPSDVPVTSLTSRIVTSMAGLNSAITNAQQIILAVQYAIDTYAIPIAIGTIETDMVIPYEELRDITVAELVVRMLRYQRDAMVWFDYSTENPTLHIRPRSALTPVTIDLGDADQIGSLSCTPRHDLVPSGVLFIFEQPVTVTVGGEPRERIRISTQSAGLGGAALGAIIQTFDLARAPVAQGGSGAADLGEQTPPSFAQKYYDALSTLHYEGELLLLEENVTRLVKLGQVLNLVDAAMPAWATMNALVQQVTYDLGGRSTRVAFGPPEQLGPQDFVSLQQGNRLPNITDFPGVRDGGEPPGPPNIRGEEIIGGLAGGGVGLSLEFRSKQRIACCGAADGPIPAYIDGVGEISGACAASYAVFPYDHSWNFALIPGGDGALPNTRRYAGAGGARYEAVGSDLIIYADITHGGGVTNIANGGTGDLPYGAVSVVVVVVHGIGNPVGCAGIMCVEQPDGGYGAWGSGRPTAIKGDCGGGAVTHTLRDAQVKCSGRSYLPGTLTYRLRVLFSQAPIGGGAATLITQTFAVSTASTGDWEYVVTFPNSPGQETSFLSATLGIG